MKVNQVKEEITMTAMETLMIIMMSGIALVVLLSWHREKEHMACIMEMKEEIHRLREDNERLHVEVAKCYVESVCNYGKTSRDLHRLMYGVDALRWSVETSKYANTDEDEELREPFFPEEDASVERDIIEGLKHDGVWDPEPGNHDKRSA